MKGRNEGEWVWRDLITASMQRYLWWTFSQFQQLPLLLTHMSPEYGVRVCSEWRGRMCVCGGERGREGGWYLYDFTKTFTWREKRRRLEGEGEREGWLCILCEDMVGLVRSAHQTRLGDSRKWGSWECTLAGSLPQTHTTPVKYIIILQHSKSVLIIREKLK